MVLPLLEKVGDLRHGYALRFERCSYTVKQDS